MSKNNTDTTSLNNISISDYSNEFKYHFVINDQQRYINYKEKCRLVDKALSNCRSHFKTEQTDRCYRIYNALRNCELNKRELEVHFQDSSI